MPSFLLCREMVGVHLLENGTDIRDIQFLLGHSQISTTIIYTYMANINTRRVKSPLDTLSQETK
ncbi:MAG: tyrosine-type recombinase/integrase [Oligoflexia bacterium]|nr:tyrosine-type recombinase/integrase [Oligoflexia bacterium]